MIKDQLSLTQLIVKEEEAEYGVITEQSVQCMFVQVCMVILCQPGVVFRTFNKGEHSELPCATTLRSDFALHRGNRFINVSPATSRCCRDFMN